MAFTSGTATDYVDLLDKLRLYLVAQGWTPLDWVAGTVAGAGGRLIVRGPGAGVGKQVFVEIYTENNLTNSFYGWRMRGMTDFTLGDPEGTHPGAQQTPVYFNIWQNAIDYWFYVNDRRFIVVAKMGTSYSSMHAGFFLPWATPANYPFPLFIGGTFGKLEAYNNTDSHHRFFADPGGYPYSTTGTQAGGQLRLPNGQWSYVSNQQVTGSNDYPASWGSGYNYCFIHPFSGGRNNRNFSGVSLRYSTSGLLESMVRTRQNEMGMWPLTLQHAQAGGQGALGAIDGAYAVPGLNMVSQQIVTLGLRNFMAFQNIHRTSGNDFIAIEEI